MWRANFEPDSNGRLARRATGQFAKSTATRSGGVRAANGQRGQAGSHGRGRAILAALGRGGKIAPSAFLRASAALALAELHCCRPPMQADALQIGQAWPVQRVGSEFINAAAAEAVQDGAGPLFVFAWIFALVAAALSLQRATPNRQALARPTNPLSQSAGRALLSSPGRVNVQICTSPLNIDRYLGNAHFSSFTQEHAGAPPSSARLETFAARRSPLSPPSDGPATARTCLMRQNGSQR